MQRENKSAKSPAAYGNRYNQEKTHKNFNFSFCINIVMM